MLHQAPGNSPSGRPSSPTLSSTSYFRPPTPPVASQIMIDPGRMHGQVRARSAGVSRSSYGGVQSTGQETVIRMYDSDGSNSSGVYDDSRTYDASQSHDASSSSDDEDAYLTRRVVVVEPRRQGVRRRPQSHQHRSGSRRSAPQMNQQVPNPNRQAAEEASYGESEDLRDQSLGIEGDDGTSDEGEPWESYGNNNASSSRGGRAGQRSVTPLQGRGEGGVNTDKSAAGTPEHSEDDSIIVVADDEDGLDGEDEFEDETGHKQMVQRGTAQPRAAREPVSRAAAAGAYAAAALGRRFRWLRRRRRQRAAAAAGACGGGRMSADLLGGGGRHGGGSGQWAVVVACRGARPG